MLSGLTRILGLPMFQVGSPHAGADTPVVNSKFAPCERGHSPIANAPRDRVRVRPMRARTLRSFPGCSMRARTLLASTL